MTFPAVDTLDTYGGKLADYAPITDPTTDRAAASANAAYASVAGMTHAALRCWVRFTTAATTGALARLTHDAPWGTGNALAPTLARTTTGVYTITWPATFVDELQVTQTVALRALALALAEGGTAYHLQGERTSANVVTVRLFTMGGVLTDGPATIMIGAL